MARPAVSIIIPAWQAMATLPLVLEPLAAEMAGAAAEVILVDSTGDGAAAGLRGAYPWLRVISLPERALPGRARNIGARESAGEVLVFLDADAVPQPGWLTALLRGLGSHPGVAGAVGNGTPRSLVGTAGWLLEFSEHLPARGDRVRHGASCNLAVTRTAFEASPRFPEDLFPGEDTVLTMRLAPGGLPFAPDAVVLHHNRTRLGPFLSHQYRLGVSFVEVCRTVPFPYARVAERRLALAAFPLRVLALARRLAGRPREAVTAVALAPLLLLGLAVWTAGVLAAPRPPGTCG